MVFWQRRLCKSVSVNMSRVAEVKGFDAGLAVSADLTELKVDDCKDLGEQTLLQIPLK